LIVNRPKWCIVDVKLFQKRVLFVGVTQMYRNRRVTEIGNKGVLFSIFINN